MQVLSEGFTLTKIDFKMTTKDEFGKKEVGNSRSDCVQYKSYIEWNNLAAALWSRVSHKFLVGFLLLGTLF